MIELRWIQLAPGEKPPLYAIPLPNSILPNVVEYRVLQYKVLLGRMDASGAFNVMQGEWSDWKDVPIE